jgi:hypothetical protein
VSQGYLNSPRAIRVTVVPSGTAARILWSSFPRRVVLSIREWRVRRDQADLQGSAEYQPDGRRSARSREGRKEFVTQFFRLPVCAFHLSKGSVGLFDE